MHIELDGKILDLEFDKIWYDQNHAEKFQFYCAGYNRLISPVPT